jgi:hypothetical protein
MPLTYNRLILAKAESSYGAVPSPAPAGTDAIRVMNDLKLSPLQMELAERDILGPYVGSRPRYATQKLAQVEFSFELVGSGTAGVAPKCGLFFRAAGYSQTIVTDTSVTYAPIGSGYESLSLDVRHGGKKHVLSGVRGELSFELKVGALPMGKFTGLGFYAVPTDASNPSLTYSSQAEPLFVGSDNTTPVEAFSYGVCLESFSFNSGRSPKLHQRAGCSKQIRIDTERKPEGEIMIESPTMAQKDFFTAAAGQTLGNIEWTHGTTAGNIVSFAAPSVSLGDPEYDDGDGVELLKLPFLPIPDASDGYDDHTFAFT